MKIPGVVWTAILALIPLLVQWLQGDYFSGQTWVSIAVIVLGFIGKVIEVQFAQQAQSRSLFTEDERSFWGKVLKG